MHKGVYDSIEKVRERTFSFTNIHTDGWYYNYKGGNTNGEE